MISLSRDPTRLSSATMGGGKSYDSLEADSVGIKRIIITFLLIFFFFQAEDGIRDLTVTGVQTCALPISVEKRRGQAASLQPVHLILHERDQGRDDDRKARQHERGDLIAERLSTPGRQHSERVVAGEHGRDDVDLSWAKVGVSEGTQERGSRRLHGWRHSGSLPPVPSSCATKTWRLEASARRVRAVVLRLWIESQHQRNRQKPDAAPTDGGVIRRVAVAPDHHSDREERDANLRDPIHLALP